MNRVKAIISLANKSAEFDKFTGIHGCFEPLGLVLEFYSWVRNQKMGKEKLKVFVGEHVLEMDPYLHEGLQEGKENVQGIHTIASTLSIISHITMGVFNHLHWRPYYAGP